MAPSDGSVLQGVSIERGGFSMFCSKNIHQTPVSWYWDSDDVGDGNPDDTDEACLLTIGLFTELGSHECLQFPWLLEPGVSKESSLHLSSSSCIMSSSWGVCELWLMAKSSQSSSEFSLVLHPLILDTIYHHRRGHHHLIILSSLTLRHFYLPSSSS
ncbi:hypothetical protein Tco_1407209 [Tanacetum coccineum]